MPDTVAHERIAVLETQIKHLDIELLEMSKKVNEMHGLLMQAKGFRWALIAFISCVSFTTGTLIPWLFHK